MNESFVFKAGQSDFVEAINFWFPVWQIAPILAVHEEG